MPKLFIMLVRVCGLAAIVFGSLLWTGRESLFAPHVIFGSIVAVAVFVLAVIALTKKAVLPGILGVVFAFLLPMVGSMQLPLAFRTLGAVQVAHIVLALLTIGVAERLYSAIRIAR